MTPTQAFAEAILTATRREGGPRGRAPDPSEPEYAAWKEIADALLNQARAFWRGGIRDRNTVVLQLISQLGKIWNLQLESAVDASGSQLLRGSVLRPAVEALLDAAAAETAANRARAAEQGRAA